MNKEQLREYTKKYIKKHLPSYLKQEATLSYGADYDNPFDDKYAEDAAYAEAGHLYDAGYALYRKGVKAGDQKMIEDAKKMRLRALSLASDWDEDDLPPYNMMTEEGLDKLDKIYNVILKYVKDPDEAMEELDAFISQGVDGFDDALYANLSRDPEFRSAYNIARKGMNELDVRQTSGTKAGVVYDLSDKKYVLKQDVKDVFIPEYIPGINKSFKTKVTLPKGTIIHNLPGGVFAKHPSLEKYERPMGRDEKYGVMVYRDKDTLSNIEKNSSMNENYRPNFDSKGYKMAQKVITQLQSSVFPKLDNDELYEFRQAIADAFNLKNL